MTDSVLAQHPPAVKVGGRRLSVSKPKSRINGPVQAEAPFGVGPAPPLAPESPSEEDYPRPAPPQYLVNEELVKEPPKKDKRQGHGNHDTEKKVREGAHSKADATRPTRDAFGGKSGFGGAGRVSQPGGKGLSA